MKKLLPLIFLTFFVSNSAYSEQNCIAGDCVNGTGVFKYKNGSKYTGKFKSLLLRHATLVFH